MTKRKNWMQEIAKPDEIKRISNFVYASLQDYGDIMNMGIHIVRREVWNEWRKKLLESDHAPNKDVRAA